MSNPQIKDTVALVSRMLFGHDVPREGVVTAVTEDGRITAEFPQEANYPLIVTDKAEHFAIVRRAPAAIDAGFVARKRAFSQRAFGEQSLAGVVNHIRKELVEVEAHPTDLNEWADVVLLALDGAWRAGYEPQEILDAVVAKQTRNELRAWPDWRTADPDMAIEHDRDADIPVQGGGVSRG